MSTLSWHSCTLRQQLLAHDLRPHSHMMVNLPLRARPLSAPFHPAGRARSKIALNTMRASSAMRLLSACYGGFLVSVPVTAEKRVWEYRTTADKNAPLGCGEFIASRFTTIHLVNILDRDFPSVNQSECFLCTADGFFSASTCYVGAKAIETQV